MKGKDLPLTPNEYALLSYLIVNGDRAIPRVELLDKIWGYETEVETRVADDTVKRLRKKIKNSDAEISTVWGYGFRLVDKNSSSSQNPDE
jgi:DNA-binding response OmpR family regulator